MDLTMTQVVFTLVQRVFSQMVKGFNSDLNIRGRTYHVQTEDWGNANPFLVTRVFANGAVLKTIKVSYVDALKGGPVQDQQALGLALRKLHQQTIDQLHSGSIK